MLSFGRSFRKRAEVAATLWFFPDFDRDVFGFPFQSSSLAERKQTGLRSNQVTSQTQAVQSTVLLSEYRLVIGCSLEVTSQTQAAQSTAVKTRHLSGLTLARQLLTY